MVLVSGDARSHSLLILQRNGDRAATKVSYWCITKLTNKKSPDYSRYVVLLVHSME